MRIVVCGSSSSRIACSHLVARELVAAAGGEHRIEHQRHVGIVGDDLGDRRDVLDAAEHADLERVDRHVLEQAARLVGDPVGVDRAARLRRRAVSCTVSAVTTDSGWQPMLASVRRSACRPAPPDGSEAANVSTIGGKCGSAIGGHETRPQERMRGERVATMRRILLQRVAPVPRVLHERRRARACADAMKKYMCLICGWIYDEAIGAPDEGIAPGTRWEDVPPNWTCPECGARKEDFEMIEF